MKGTHCVEWPRAGGGAAFWLVPGGAKSLQSAWAPWWRRGRALKEGGASDLSIKESSGGSTYHRGTLSRRDRGGKAVAGRGGARPAGANPPGGTRGRGRRARPKHSGPGALWSRSAPRPSGARARQPPPLLGTPTFVGQAAPRPSCAGAAWRRLPGSARCSSLLHPSLTSYRFSSFSVNNSWVAEGGGKVAPAEPGGAPPTHPRAAVRARGWRR